MRHTDAEAADCGPARQQIRILRPLKRLRRAFADCASRQGRVDHDRDAGADANMISTDRIETRTLTIDAVRAIRQRLSSPTDQAHPVESVRSTD
jgi:hypothetical protein